MARLRPTGLAAAGGGEAELAPGSGTMAPERLGFTEAAAADPYAFAVAHRRLARLGIVGGFERGFDGCWHAAVVAWSELLPLR